MRQWLMLKNVMDNFFSAAATRHITNFYTPSSPNASQVLKQFASGTT
jgi:hypothetical protein